MRKFISKAAPLAILPFFIASPMWGQDALLEPSLQDLEVVHADDHEIAIYAPGTPERGSGKPVQARTTELPQPCEVQKGEDQEIAIYAPGTPERGSGKPVQSRTSEPSQDAYQTNDKKPKEMVPQKVTTSPEKYPAYPRVPQWTSLSTWVDFLYLQAFQDNMEPAGIKQSLITTGFVGLEQGVVVQPVCGFKPAFEAGLALNLTHRDIDLWVDYFRYWSNNETLGLGNQYFPGQLGSASLLAFLNGISVAGGGIGTAAPYSFTQLWTLEMSFLDLMTGYLMEGGRISQWHPFAGLRGGWINQRIDINYTANFVNGGAQAGTAHTVQDTSSWAIGPRIGVDGNWWMGQGFSLYGLVAGDILYSNYNWHLIDAVLVPGGNVNWNENLTNNDISTIRTHLEIELGFRWSKYCNHHRTLLDFSGGYGFQVFFDQNMFRHFTTAYQEIAYVGLPTTILSGIIGTPISRSPDGALYLQGLRVEAKVSF